MYNYLKLSFQFNSNLKGQQPQDVLSYIAEDESHYEECCNACNYEEEPYVPYEVFIRDTEYSWFFLKSYGYKITDFHSWKDFWATYRKFRKELEQQRKEEEDELPF